MTSGDWLTTGFKFRRLPNSNNYISIWEFTQDTTLGIGGVVAACTACHRKVVGSNPGSALLIPEVNVVDIQLRALLGLCSLLVHSA